MRKQKTKSFRITAVLFVLMTGLLSVVEVRAAADPNKTISSSEIPAKSFFSEPLVDPRALLIRDDAVRSQLSLDAAATAKLEILCNTLDPLLFAMRDVPAESTHPMALQYSVQILKELKALSEILTPAQQLRLGELTIQYHGFPSLLWPVVTERLKLADTQLQSISRILTETRGQLDTLKQKEQSKSKPSPKDYQQILDRQQQNMIAVLSPKQQMQWMKMQGRPFNFSVLKPLLFLAPELKDVTTWINSGPLTLSGLRGKVIIVHFWTFNCGNCINNYPAYKRWLEKYNSSNVVMIGIHTPETPAEESVDKITAKAQENGLKFAIAVDNSKANWNRWSNTIWPGVYLVDKKGKVRFWWYGELNWQGAKGEQWMTDKIDQLLKE
jgi:thiol-disulfide isomerase/thioredoxin